jgi:hypothetical protein
MLSTRKGDIVADLTAGAGSGMEAAIQCSRRYIGFEQDKDMYEVSCTAHNTFPEVTVLVVCLHTDSACCRFACGDSTALRRASRHHQQRSLLLSLPAQGQRRWRLFRGPGCSNCTTGASLPATHTALSATPTSRTRSNFNRSSCWKNVSSRRRTRRRTTLSL